MTWIEAYAGAIRKAALGCLLCFPEKIRLRQFGSFYWVSFIQTVPVGLCYREDAEQKDIGEHRNYLQGWDNLIVLCFLNVGYGQSTQEPRLSVANQGFWVGIPLVLLQVMPNDCRKSHSVLSPEYITYVSGDVEVSMQRYVLSCSSLYCTGSVSSSNRHSSSKGCEAEIKLGSDSSEFSVAVSFVSNLMATGDGEGESSLRACFNRTSVTSWRYCWR